MSSIAPRRLTFRLLPRFRRHQGGATAVEFAIVAAPFFAFLMGSLELALAFWSTQVLETAVANASRQIYTGQFQTSASNQGLTAAQLQSQFKNLVCSNVSALFDCPSQVSVDVQKVSTFSNATLPSPVNAQNQYDTSAYGYNAPGPRDIAVVRASLKYPLYVGRVGQIILNAGTLADGNRLIMATAVFRTEPF